MKGDLNHNTSQCHTFLSGKSFKASAQLQEKGCLVTENPTILNHFTILAYIV
jgi:hypothetical protein